MIKSNILVVNKLGLHARASAKLAQEANHYSSRITLEHMGQTVDCKSIMSIMLLAAGVGTELAITVEGDDEKAAHEAIVSLFANMFGEEE